MTGERVGSGVVDSGVGSGVGDGVGSSVVGSGDVGAGVAGSGVLSISVVVGDNVFCVHALTTGVSLVRSAMDDTPRMMIDRCNMVIFYLGICLNDDR